MVLKCVLQVSSNSITWNLLEMQILRPCPDLLNQKLKVRPVNLFAGSPGVSDIHSILRTTEVNHFSLSLGVTTITAKFNKPL